jgi:cytosine/adenosine deaminase-related metal-dependent hydrolase
VWDPVAAGGGTGDSIYSSIVYSAGPQNVDSVMIDGKWIFRSREFTGIDEGTIVRNAQKELALLLDRL